MWLLWNLRVKTLQSIKADVIHQPTCTGLWIAGVRKSTNSTIIHNNTRKDFKMDHPTGTWNRNRSSYLQKQLWDVLSWHTADVQLQSIQVHSVMLRDEKQEEKGLAMTGKWPLILKQPWLKGGRRSSFQGRPREDTWNTNNSAFRKMNAYPQCVTWVEKGGVPLSSQPHLW